MRIIPDLVPLPPPPTEIHESPCAPCPSTKDLSEDWESQEIREAPRDVRIAHAFRCAWRPGKLCKGYCDFNELTQEDFPNE